MATKRQRLEKLEALLVRLIPPGAREAIYRALSDAELETLIDGYLRRRAGEPLTAEQAALIARHEAAVAGLPSPFGGRA